MSDVRALIVEYFEQAKLMQLSTCVDNRPWTCSVWFGFDVDLNIYWTGRISRRHSHEVEINRNVSGAIALPHTPDDPPRGISFEGVDETLTSAAGIAAARTAFEGRIFDADRITKLLGDAEDPHVFHRITPSSIVMFDVVNFPDAFRQEYRP